jgi:LmbE family N-acetylglucosaminyl deacetylase
VTPHAGSAVTADRSAVAFLGTILGVWAHPDDEAFLSAGIMALATDAGQRVVVVSATAGGLGGPADVRRVELTRALAAVGVVEHLVLGYPDGGCDRVPVAEAAAGLARIVGTVEPDTILTFGPDGLTGHADHRAVSTWVRAARSSVSRPVRVLHATTTPEFSTRWAAVHERFAVFEPGLPRTHERQSLAVHVELPAAVQRRKVAALAAHRSQTAGLLAALGEDGMAAWWATESFVDADDEGLHDLSTSSPRSRSGNAAESAT